MRKVQNRKLYFSCLELYIIIFISYLIISHLIFHNSAQANSTTEKNTQIPSILSLLLLNDQSDVNAPIAYDQDLIVDEEGSIQIIFNGLDPNGQSLQYHVIDQPTHGFLDTIIKTSQSGNYNTPDRATDVYVINDYAFIADANSGLIIVDVSNPDSPLPVGSYNTPGKAISVFVSGSYAYVADGDAGLQIIDVSNPSSPKLAGTYDTIGYAYDVTVTGQYAYVADNYSTTIGKGVFHIFNVSNPYSPILESTFYAAKPVYYVNLIGDYAYIGFGFGDIYIVNVSNPSSPKLSGTYEDMGRRFFFENGYGYSVNYYHLKIYDVNDPANPTLVGQFTHDSFSTSYSSVFVSDGYAFAVSGQNDLRLDIIDVSDPTSPYLKGNYGFENEYIYNVWVNNGYAYVTNDYDGLQILKLDKEYLYTPQNDYYGQDSFSFIANNGLQDSLPAIISIQVNNTYDPPVVDAGEDAVVGRSKEIQLNAGESYSPDGLALTYHWTQISGPYADIYNSDSATPTIVAPDIIGPLIFQLSASDGQTTLSDTVSVSVVNLPPVAMAGDDQNVSAGDSVTLDGSGSYDIDPMDDVTYKWTLVWGPDDFALDSPQNATQNFIAPYEPALLVFELEASDGNGGTDSDQISITVGAPPIVKPSASINSTQINVEIPTGSELSLENVSYVTFGSSSSINTTGDGSAVILDMGAPSLGILTDFSGAPVLFGVHIPASAEIHLDRFPELEPYLSDGSKTPRVDSESTALGILLMNPFMMMTTGEDRINFLGYAINHPMFVDLSNAVETALYMPGIRIPDLLENESIKNFYGRIIRDIINALYPSIDQGVPIQSTPMLMDAQSSQAIEDRQVNVYMSKPAQEFRNPFYVFYNADIMENPDSNQDSTNQLIPRRSKIFSFSYLTGISDPYGSASYPFKNNVPYQVDINQNKPYSIVFGSLKFASILIGFETKGLNPESLTSLALDLDYTAVENLGHNVVARDWPAVGVNFCELIADNLPAFYGWLINNINGLAGINFQDILNIFVKNSNVAGWIIKGAKTINTTIPLVVDLFSAPECFAIDVYWGIGEFYGDNPISTSNGECADGTPEVIVNASVLSGTVPLNVTFDASDSFDPDGDTMSFSYSLDSNIKADLANTPVYTHSFLRPGQYTMRVGVSDGEYGSYKDITITVNPASNNSAPVADAGLDMSVEKGQTVILDGLNTYDPDNDFLTFQWRQLNGIARTMRDPTSAAPRFIAPMKDDILLFELSVSDGQYESKDYVQVTVGSPIGGNITLIDPGLYTEGSTRTASVSISETVNFDTVVWLTASPNGIVEVPKYTILLAGNTTSDFDIKVLSDTDNIEESFTVEAEATGWNGDSFNGKVVEPQTADIQVFTTGVPSAPWTISGPSLSGTYNGGMAFSNVNPGYYTVTFLDATGYYTPSAQTKYVGNSGIYYFTGTYYSQSLGDVTVTKRNDIQLTFFDHGAIDGDIIDVYLNGAKVLSNHSLIAPPGYNLNINLNSGANTISIKALNEGSDSPNTATVQVSDVISGESEKVYDILTGASAGFNIIAP